MSMLRNLPRLAKGYQPIFVDYPVDPVPRYGYGKPGHPELTAILASHDELYRRTLSGFLRFAPELLRIPIYAPEVSCQPSWTNKWFTGLDMFALYGFVAERRPSLYVEIGSGVSTRLVYQAVQNQSLGTQIYSIDPHPRAEIDSICNKVIREPLERNNLSFVHDLRAGDILFVDGSHRSFMNSDVTVVFLDILPRLKPGVAVHFHDVYLPMDYPPERAHWFYSEQYLLAASLLAGHKNYEILLPSYYISVTPDVRKVVDDFWNSPELTGISAEGGSFWIQTV